ncbi:unnamed protein product [Closterium sp. NIES-54]
MPMASAYPLPPSKKQCLEPSATAAVPACAIPPPHAQALAPFCPPTAFAAEIVSTADEVKADLALLQVGSASAQAQHGMGFRSSSCSSSDEDEEGDSDGPSLVEHDGETEAGSPTSVIVSQIGARTRVTATEVDPDLGLSVRAGGIKIEKSGADDKNDSLVSASTAQVSNSLSPTGAVAKSRSFKVPPPTLIIPCSASADEGEARAEVPFAPAVPAIGGAVLASPFMLRNCLWDSSDLNCPWADDLDMDTSAALPVLPSPKFIPLTPSSTAFGSFSFGTSTPGNNTNSSNYSYGYSSNSGNSSSYNANHHSSSSAAAHFSFPTHPTPPASTAAADLTAFDHLPQPLSDSHLALHSVMDGSDSQRLGGAMSRCEGLGSAGVGSGAAAAGELVPMALVSPPLPGTVPLPSGALDGLTLEMDENIRLGGEEMGNDVRRDLGEDVGEEDVGLDAAMCLSPEEFDSFDLGLPPGVCPSPMPGFTGSIFAHAAATTPVAASASAAPAATPASAAPVAFSGICCAQ